MKQEIIIQWIKELFNSVNELHQEYCDDNISYVIDAQKEDNVLHITISVDEYNQDKIEFENWLKKVDDDLFEEVLDELGYDNNLSNLNDIYNSDNYQEVINMVKSKTLELANKKIQQLQNILN